MASRPSLAIFSVPLRTASMAAPRIWLGQGADHTAGAVVGVAVESDESAWPVVVEQEVLLQRGELPIVPRR
ncbi:hypothetical protein OG581_52320 [Streptomyces sp. NBC_01386]|uniref:hypothetical protein n=1 Tax=Streptomyces sp. NBC_01386 TaxID=2903848 RepID=UPI00325058B7